MKELLAYLLLILATYFTLGVLKQQSKVIDMPHLVTYQSFIMFDGHLTEQHPSLPLYERVYLLSDTATASSPYHQPIRLFSRPEEMSGIIYFYDSFELSPPAMNKGFLDIGNLQSYMSKTILLPLNRQQCLGEWEKRNNGLDVCKIEITAQLLIKSARIAAEKAFQKGLEEVQQRSRQQLEEKLAQSQELKLTLGELIANGSGNAQGINDFLQIHRPLVQEQSFIHQNYQNQYKSEMLTPTITDKPIEEETPPLSEGNEDIQNQFLPQSKTEDESQDIAQQNKDQPQLQQPQKKESEPNHQPEPATSAVTELNNSYNSNQTIIANQEQKRQPKKEKQETQSQNNQAPLPKEQVRKDHIAAQTKQDSPEQQIIPQTAPQQHQHLPQSTSHQILEDQIKEQSNQTSYDETKISDLPSQHTDQDTSTNNIIEENMKQTKTTSPQQTGEKESQHFSKQDNPFADLQTSETASSDLKAKVIASVPSSGNAQSQSQVPADPSETIERIEQESPERQQEQNQLPQQQEQNKTVSQYLWEQATQFEINNNQQEDSKNEQITAGQTKKQEYDEHYHNQTDNPAIQQQHLPNQQETSQQRIPVTTSELNQQTPRDFKHQQTDLCPLKPIYQIQIKEGQSELIKIQNQPTTDFDTPSTKQHLQLASDLSSVLQRINNQMKENQTSLESLEQQQHQTVDPSKTHPTPTDTHRETKSSIINNNESDLNTQQEQPSPPPTNTLTHKQTLQTTQRTISSHHSTQQNQQQPSHPPQSQIQPKTDQQNSAENIDKKEFDHQHHQFTTTNIKENEISPVQEIQPNQNNSPQLIIQQPQSQTPPQSIQSQQPQDVTNENPEDFPESQQEIYQIKPEIDQYETDPLTLPTSEEIQSQQQTPSPPDNMFQ